MGFHTNINIKLQNPLSPTEEAECIEGLRHGDSKAKETLIERNLRLVTYIINKFESSGYDSQDLFSIGSMGLIKAVNTFDPNKGIKPATYFTRVITNDILMYFRKEKNGKTMFPSMNRSGLMVKDMK